MGIISYDLLSKQKARKQNLRVDIDICLDLLSLHIPT